MGLGALLERALTGIAHTVRRPSSAEQFRRADRLRHEGRYAEATRLVADGLSRSPGSAAGHLLAAYIHFSSRDIRETRASFERVLAIDPDHPRALLGLARLALEEGHPEVATPYLRRALQYHPGFPEAAALEEMIAGWATSGDAAPPARPAVWPLAPGARDAILTRADGAVVFVQCDEPRQPALSQHVTQIARIAAATLARAGLGHLRRAVVEGQRGTLYLQSDGALVLSITTPATADMSDGMSELERLWSEHVAGRGLHG
jgi:tetratricopeptide (TPR) repeat protein